MKHKILWMLLSWLIVGALVLASCGEAVPGEQEEEEEEEEPVGEQEEEEEPVGEQEEEEEEEPAVGEPQYGGRLTVFRGHTGDPEGPDIATGSYPNTWLETVQERAVIGDFEKYGPRGTGEYPFLRNDVYPEAYLKGCLLESWEVTTEKVVWHVRPGVHWAPDEDQSAWMPVREVVADDIVADLIYFRDAPPGKAFRAMSGDIYTTDKYTLEIMFSDLGFNMNMMYVVGYEDRALISPPEMLDAPGGGANSWKNQVGTGPFKLKEYVVGSHMTFVRNPDYRGRTTIDGVEYQTPFVDELMIPIIADAITQVAATRTGVVDFNQSVLPMYWSDLDKTTPALESLRSLSGYAMGLAFKCTKPPFDAAVVRRALMIALNLEAFRDLHGVGPLLEHWYPVLPGDVRIDTPMEELPAETLLLYDYNPELAKQMLADAGYPDGFSMEYYSQSTAQSLDRAALLQAFWDEVGVKVSIKPVDQVTYRAMQADQSYTDAIGYGMDIASPVDSLLRKGRTGYYYNFAGWSNERYDYLIDTMLAEPDVAMRNPLIKEASVLILNECPYIPTDPTPYGQFWWPWIKNYYGERFVSDKDCIHILATAWIDQDLKAEMGY